MGRKWYLWDLACLHLTVLLCSALWWLPSQDSKISVNSARPKSSKVLVWQKKGTALSAAPTNVPFHLLVSHWIRCSSLNKWLLSVEFDSRTGQTGVICPLLIVGLWSLSRHLSWERNTVQWFPWRKDKWMWDGFWKSCQLQPLCLCYVCMIEL